MSNSLYRHVSLDLFYQGKILGDRKEIILTPGVNRSGLIGAFGPSIVGPRLEKSATESSDRSIVSISFATPTVITLGLIPGIAIVC
ncbi:Uncharacterised protein [Bacillus freudenreichii]|nr:Uncharacterised protein [Bacillus freudenreichii]